jgi:DNA invertase Pin-like site-specific DNA recombinase
MIYGYIRVSTDKQTVENQRFELENFATRKGFRIDEFIEEVVSGTKAVADRKLSTVIPKMQKGDTLIVAELSRIGRKLLDIMTFLNEVMKKGLFLFAVKEGYELGDNINSKVLAFAFGLSAEIERNLIAQRTFEGLERRKAMGLRLGRPKGAVTKKTVSKCYKHRKEIAEYVEKGYSISAIARIIGVHRITVADWINKGSKKQDDSNKSSDRISEASKVVKKMLPNFKNGDIGYLRDNKQLFIQVKNLFPYPTLSVSMGISFLLV